jgi:hypothetical protein
MDRPVELQGALTVERKTFTGGHGVAVRGRRH